MESDKDAICKLMDRGLWDEDTYDTDSDYEVARALWRKWCDPTAVECPNCHGEGGWLEEWDYNGEHHFEIDECSRCHRTGKVDAPPPPPKPAPLKPLAMEYQIVSGGTLNGEHRVWAWRTNPQDSKLFKAGTEAEARQRALEWRYSLFEITPPS